MKKVKREGKEMKKVYMIPMLAVFGLALVFAGIYVVNSFTMTIDVAEPFSVQYAMIGDSGNYEGTPTCQEYSDTSGSIWFTSEDNLPTGQMYVGESRKFCVRITNVGEGDIPYVVQSSIVTGSGNYEDCAVAFPETTLEGVAVGSDVTINGEAFTIPADAPVVNDCQIEISVARGTLE